MGFEKVKDVFRAEKPVIGIVHFNGSDFEKNKIRGNRDVLAFENTGFDGVALEVSFLGRGTFETQHFLKAIGGQGMDNYWNVVPGVSTVPSLFGVSMGIAGNHGGRFVYTPDILNQFSSQSYYQDRKKGLDNTLVIGGIESIDSDFREATIRSDALAVSAKNAREIGRYRKAVERVAGNYPIFAKLGVCLTDNEIYELASEADGLIVDRDVRRGYRVTGPVELAMVRIFMNQVLRARRVSSAA